MATMFDIKIFGERNTGTHALRELIETNSASRCAPSVAREVDERVAKRLKRLKMLRWIGFSDERILGKREELLDAAFENADALHSWKHCATNFETVGSLENVTVLFLVRHPASWLLSLFKNPYHLLPPPDGTLADFISRRRRTVARERLGEASLRPLEIYNLKIASYLKLRSQLEASGMSSRIIRFEDNIINQPGVYEDIRNMLVDPDETFSPVVRSTKSSGKTLEEYADYYRREAWRTQLTGLEAAIDSQVNWEQISAFDYRPVG